MLRVEESRELQAILLALKQADKKVVSDINKGSRSVLKPEWQTALNAKAHTTAEKRLIAGSASVLVGATQVTLKAGALSRKLSGGFDGVRAVEFGAVREHTGRVRGTSPQGKKYTMTRHTQRQLTPQSKGYVAYPAAASFVGRAAALWIQSAVRVFANALEGK